jgi:uncharacterized membrane protein
MTIEEAFKMIISFGIVSPDTLPSAKASQIAADSGSYGVLTDKDKSTSG